MYMVKRMTADTGQQKIGSLQLKRVI